MSGMTTYVLAQNTKINDKNIIRKQEIQDLEIKINDISDGIYDEEIQLEKNNHCKLQEERERAKKEKKIIESKEKKEKKEKSNAFYQQNRQSDKEKRFLSKDTQRYYNHYLKASNSIPSYILNNLKQMPENKGYFWKSVACFGELPAEKGKHLTLFEKKRGGILVIHEWSDTEYKIFNKIGKDKKQLVSTQYIKNKK